MNAAQPLDAFPLVRTRNIEDLEAALARIFAKPVLEIVGRDRTLRAVQNHCQLRHIGVSYGSYGIDVRFRFPEPQIVSQIFPIRGKAEVLVDGTSVAINPDCGVAISANTTTFNMTSAADYERLILIVSAEALTTKLAAIVGHSIEAPLKIHPVQDFARPSARILRDNFMFLVGQLNAGRSLPSLVLDEFEQTIMTMFLHANRHNYSHLLEQEPRDAAPAQVRLAEDYIEANWNKPMSLEAIAAATEVSIRSLFRGFRHSRGYSPSEFLRQVRLRHARELLRRPHAPATVMEIAFACGFGDLERFSRDYCRAFGERPSQTLARGKGSAWH